MQSGQAPQQYGKYSLIEKLAVGGMAEIYRAKTFGAAGFEKDLVIKRILERYSADDEFVRMFIDEARLAARLQHANVVQIYDFDCVETPAGASYYIAMEWVDGRDVRHLLKEGFKQKIYPSQAMAVHIAVETLKGLHYAHTRSEGGKPLDIVHRDVSPHNILLSYSGDVKISDFGIAKAAARASATSNGMVKGKLAYMSPEQVTGQPLDRRTDLFSLGIVLYEMVTHTRLFAGTSEVEVIGRVRDGQVPSPRSKNPEIAPDLEAVLLQILAADRNQRFATAADAAKALSSTSVYSANESLLVGEYVSRIFPPGAPSEPPRALKSTPVEKKIIMANPSQPKPPGAPPPSSEPMTGAATMMLEVPVAVPQKAAATPIADQKTAILDTSSSQGQEIHAQIEAARAKFAAGAPAAPAARAPAPSVVVAPAPVVKAAAVAVVVAPAATPIVDQKTAILDTHSPQGQALQAQIEAARIKASSPAPPPAAPAATPMTDQKTAILDTHSPQGQAMQAQIEAARIKMAEAARLSGPR